MPLTDLKILILIALALLLSPRIARFARLPISAVEIILGALAAGAGLIGPSENFKIMADVGFCYLMFIAGMEVNLRSLFALPRSLALSAAAYIFLLYAFSAAAVWVLDLPMIFIIILPVMSVGLITLLFKDFGRSCPWLGTAMLTATLAELVSIMLFTIAAAALREGANAWEIAGSILYLNIFLALCLAGFKFLNLLFWWYPQLKIILLPHEDGDEKDLRFCMAIFILIIVAMLITQLELVLGAFIAGSFVATFFSHKRDLEHKISSLGYGLLVPIFFLHIGSSFDLSALLDPRIVANALLFALLMIILRLLCATVFWRPGRKEQIQPGLMGQERERWQSEEARRREARRGKFWLGGVAGGEAGSGSGGFGTGSGSGTTGGGLATRLGLRELILLALAHSMPLTLLIALATLCLYNGVLSPSTYSSLVLCAIIEAVVVLVLIRLLARRPEAANLKGA